MNIVIDSLIKNCKGDPDRVLSMGLSIGGSAALDYAIEYPQRAASIITSSPVFVRGYATSIGPAVHLPIWMGNGGIDVNPLPDDINFFESQYNTNFGGNLTRSFYPSLGHVMWDPMWAEEPRYNNAISTAHKANPLIFFNKKYYCPGATVSSRLGITQGFAQYQWDKNGVVIPGATSNEYTATDFGTYRARFKRTASSDWSDWSPVPAVISPICPPVAGTGTGLKGTYYNNKNLTPPSSATRTDATVNFAFDGNTSPASSVPATNFSVRWTGKIQPQFSETYTIYTNSDDGIRLWINGVQVINNFTDHAATDNSGTIALTANQKYDIKIEYYNAGGPGSALLSWSSFSQAKQIVPKTQLYPDGTGDPDIPLCTTNTSPANGSTIAAGTSVALNWNSIFNAASYDVYVWTGATPPSLPTTNVTTNTYTATGLVASSTYNWYVVPKNITGSATGCSTNNKTTFITPAGVPICATNSLPANASTIVTPTTAMLSWGAVGNATSYDVYIWSGATPPATATATVTAPTVSYNATSLTPATLYNWYVIPKNAIGPAASCNISAKSTFTTAAVIPVPSCTANSTPVNGAVVGTQVSADLAWAAAANATSYDIYVYTGTTIPSSPTVTIAAPAVTYTAVGLSANTTYKWFVVPKNATGNATGCSGNATTFVTAPLPPLCTPNLLPANNATLVPATATLSWTAAPTATSYDIYLYTGTTIPTIPTATVSGATSYTTTILEYSTTYNWFVVPKNAGGSPTGCSANATSFTTVAPPAPSCTPNLTPAANATLVPITATLSWTAAAGATSYDVYIYTGTTVPTLPTATVNAVTSYTSAAALAYSTTYNWFVVPRNESGSATGCSTNVTSFTTIPLPAPSCTPNLAPAANAALVPTTATLTWTAAANATDYDIYVYTGTVVPGSPTATVTGLTTYTTALLAYATTYNWFVVPKNATGSATGCSGNATSFTTIPVPAPSCTPNLAPVANATLMPTTATLTWTAAPGATAYDVYVYTGTVVPGSPTATVSGVTTYTTAALSYSTTYNWFVVPKNESGDATGCSGNATSFTTIPLPVPLCAANVSPANNATLVPTAITLTWTASVNATSYDVYLWTGGVVPSTPVATVATVSYDASGLVANSIYNWYVVPKNATGSATGCSTSNKFTFTTAPTLPPLCTSNISPASNAVLATPATATLTWTAAPNADFYDVYLWTGVIAPSTPVATVATPNYSATGLVASSVYNWYIVPKNAGGTATGCAGNATTFTTAADVPACTATVSPVSGTAIGTPTTAALTWAASPGATLYDIYVYTGTTIPFSPTATVTAPTVTYNATGLTALTTYNWFVVPKNITGAAANCSVSNKSTFTTSAIAAPVCATNTAPANASIIVSQTTVTLTWGTVPTATSYDVFLWTGGPAPALPVATVASGAYSTSGLTAGTTYTWYVVPKNASGGASNCGITNSWTFTTQSAAVTPPGCATGNIPVSGTLLGTQTSASLAWTTVNTATSYDVYLWTGPTPPSSATINVAANSYSPANLLPGTTYSWYVVPKNTGGPAVGCSGNVFTFTTAAVPVPLCAVNSSPVSGTTILTQNTASLVWGNIADATSYDVYIWTGITVPTTATATVTTNTYPATGLIANTTYNWYVVPKNTSGPATGCDLNNKSTFTTAQIPAPLCTTNSSPIGGIAIATSTTAPLVWTAATNATAYDIYIWTGATPPTTAVATVTSGTTYTATGLTANSTYNWYVVPKNASGPATGCAGNVSTFTTAPIPVPSCTPNVAPANNAALVPIVATLTWTAAANATAYDVYVYTGTVVPGTPTATVTGATTYTTAALANATTYNWYVVPKNASGPATGCSSNATSFTTIAVAVPAPSCTPGVTPANNATLVPIVATLTWTAAANATAYDVYVYTGTIVPGTPTATVTGATTFTTAALANATTYNWFVVPKNASGPATGCSSNATSFTTIAIAAPSCTPGVTPANNAALVPVTATLTWTAAATAISYDVYIYTGTTVPTLPTATVSGATTYTTAALANATTYNWFVVPRNASGPATGCSGNAIAFTTIPVPAPSCTVNLAPANNTTAGAPTTATLTWTAAANATSYDVYVYTGTVVPGSPTATVSGVTTYTAIGLTASTVYNWFVVPKNTTGSATGCVSNKFTFTTAANVAGTGLTGTYYNGMTLTGTPLLARVDPTVNFDIGNGSPAPGTVPVDFYSVRWTGQVKAVYSETYTFYTNADDGIRLWVNGVQLVNNWVDQGTTEKSGSIALVAGQKYDIVVEYYEKDGGSVTQLQWSSASTPKAIVPQSQLYPTGIVTPVIISCAVNTVPATGSTLTTSTAATLSWAEVAGAASYDVYVYTGATAPASPTGNTTATTYFASGLSGGSTYNWFVLPKNAAGSAAGCGTISKSTFITANVTATDGTGLQGVYYNGMTLSGTPLLTRVDPTIDFDLGTGSPAAGTVPVDFYSVRWTGQVKAVYSETYTFYTNADDGIRLWVNGVQLVNNWADQAPTEKSGAIALVAGQKYDIVVEYYEKDGGALTQLKWSSASTPKAIVPQTQLYPPVGAVPVPSCTPNVTPANNAALVPITATLTWTAAANATAYDVYVYTGTVVPGTPTATVTGATTYTTAALANATTYNWFVVPKNASGPATGCAGNASTFTTAPIPVPSCTPNVAPTNNAALVPITATLTWTAAANATAYDVYVYTGTVVPGTPTATVTGATTYTTAALANATTYNWYVVPKNASGPATGCSSNATSFTTIAVAVPAPSCTPGVTPANNATLVPITATLTWTAAANATAYDVYVYTGTVVPGTPTATVTGATTFTTAALANATTYNWFVVPKNASGPATGCSSNATSFTTIAIAAPSCTPGVTPANNAALVPVTATLTWTAAATAISYDVYIYTGTTVPTLPTATVSGATTYTTAALANATTYNWFVVPRNASGPATGCSGNAIAFTTIPVPAPSCTVNLAPANNTTAGAPTTATLTWTAAANATSYDVYVYTGTVVPGSPTATVSGVTTYTAIGLTASTVYNWFVVPKNTTGSATGCVSNKFTFTTAANVAGTGLTGTYYNGMTLTGTPLLARVDPTVNFDIGNGSPAPGTVPVDFYSVRWTGQVKAVYSETYTFYTNADDGIRLWVNGVQLVNNWVDQGTTEKSGSIALVAGQKYDIVVEYYEKDGGSVTQLQWSSASTPKAIVPQSQLYPTGIVTPVIISCAVNTVPATGSTLTTSTAATLSWAEVAGAASYDVYVYTGATAPASPTAIQLQQHTSQVA